MYVFEINLPSCRTQAPTNVPVKTTKVPKSTKTPAKQTEAPTKAPKVSYNGTITLDPSVVTTLPVNVYFGGEPIKGKWTSAPIQSVNTINFCDCEGTTIQAPMMAQALGTATESTFQFTVTGQTDCFTVHLKNEDGESYAVSDGFRIGGGNEPCCAS